MFLKLTKHELAESGRIMLPLCGLLVLLAGIGNLSLRYLNSANATSVFLEVSCILLLVLFFLGCFAVCVVAFVMMIERFRRTVLTDRGYLTNTLPVSAHAIIWSRLLSAFLYAVLVAVSLLLSVLLLTAGTVVASGIMPEVQFYWSETGLPELLRSVDWTAIVIEFCVSLPLSFILLCFHFYAALAVGHSFADHKILLSIAFYFVISAVYSLLSNTVLAVGGTIPALAASDSLRVFAYNSSTYLLTNLLFEAIMAAGMYFLTWYMMKKHLNLA